MTTLKVSGRGQIVIPLDLRQKFGIKPGDQVRCYERNGEICLTPMTAAMIDQNIGFLQTKGKLLRALMAENNGSVNYEIDGHCR